MTTPRTTAAAADVWFVYVLLCADGSLYTGVAKDVTRRVRAHDEGKGARYTRGRGPLELVASARCGTHGQALRVELAMKRLAKDEKVRVTRSGRSLAAFARAHRDPPR
ncbi:MAG: GIY-YIG nuclease family protein [Polyangiaceae bacterium]